MFCPKCGSQNSDTAGFCASCGAPLKTAANTGGTFGAPPPPPPPAPPHNYGGGSVKPKNWLVESILVTILCCLPFGIAGIVNATKVDSKYAAGDYAGAEQASQEAAKWTKIGFFVGIGLSVIYFIWMVAMGGMAAMQGGY